MQYADIHVFPCMCTSQMLKESSQDWSELQRIVQDNPQFPLPLKKLPWKHMVSFTVHLYSHRTLSFVVVYLGGLILPAKLEK